MVNYVYYYGFGQFSKENNGRKKYMYTFENVTLTLLSNAYLSQVFFNKMSIWTIIKI